MTPPLLRLSGAVPAALVWLSVKVTSVSVTLPVFTTR